jgi:osmotically-inducible protein OsmY
MTQQKSNDNESVNVSDLHPRHEAWARFSTHSSLIGVGIALALGVLFAITIALHFSLGAYVVLGLAACLILLWLIWKSIPKQRRGVLGNAQLTAAIKADLITELNADGVNVDSSGGVVTLRGMVPYADFRDAAEHLARRHGAHEVINELEIDPATPVKSDSYLQGFPGVTTPEGAPAVVTGSPLAEQIQAAFAADSRVNANVVIVQVEDGIAYLTGRQGTVQASEAAAEIALHISGILGVSNDIEIMPSV